VTASWPAPLGVALALASAPALLASAYLGLLAAFARRRAPSARGTFGTRFDVIVPAHNEEAGIGATLASVRAVTYPTALVRVIVVADNCTDDTATRAREAGALVLERWNPERRGKGYALAHAVDASLAHGFADAIVVVDADTTVSPNLLAAFDASLSRGLDALKADYGVRNPNDSRRTRLTALGLAVFHGVRSVARERLGLSCGLRGNGMCFRTALLRRLPPRAFSITEDLEYGIHLGLAGVRVAYVGEARVLGEMPVTSEGSRSQRERWENGRRALAREYVPALLRRAVARRDAMMLDLALDLLVPPLSRVVTWIVLGWTLSAVVVASIGAAKLAFALWTVAALTVLAYVARGCTMSQLGVRSARDLVWAPAYMLWKLSLSRRPVAAGAAWVRTTREHSSGIR
jgi:cellulose synthase/poly-beta-1,6-N-acetylglucosamine synthase-like glycosyltransferase